MASESRPLGPYPSPPEVPLQACPIATTLRSLGRKWTLTILRDIAFFPRAGFAAIRKGNPGLRPRTLSLRLRELEAEGLVRKVVPPEDRRHPYYELTATGLEVWPILAALFQFGIRHHAATVFSDAVPRDLAEVYPRDSGLLLGPLAEYARAAQGSAAPAPVRTAASASSRGTDARR